MVEEIKAEDLNPEEFIEEMVGEISIIVGDGIVINALSGGVDSSVVTVLGHRALGSRLKTYFIDNGLMRQGEPQQVVSLFKTLGIRVEMIDARAEFLDALRGVTGPEEKREVISQVFYREIFAELAKEIGALFIFQGTILTDADEAVAGIKRQHNVFEQLGIDPQKAFGYKIIEPLIRLRKDGVRKVAKALGLPKSVCNRIPFPGPALAIRIMDEVTPEEVRLVRQATAIVESMLAATGAFQYSAILHEDRFTGIDGILGRQIEVGCWDSVDGRTAEPTDLSYDLRRGLVKRITTEIPEVVRVTFNMTPKPPSTIEAM